MTTSYRVVVLPAIVSAAAAATVVLALDLHRETGQEAFPRHRVPAPTASSTDGATPSQPTTVRPPLVLEAGGLSVVGFGQSARVALNILTDRLGAPDESAPGRCRQVGTGPSRWVRWADLTVRLESDRFVGYIEGTHFPPGGPPWGFATGEGLAPGDSATSLKRDYGRAVEIGPRHRQPGRTAVRLFTVTTGEPPGGLSGAIERDGGSAIVTSIFAGDLCS